MSLFNFSYMPFAFSAVLEKIRSAAGVEGNAPGDIVVFVRWTPGILGIPTTGTTQTGTELIMRLLTVLEKPKEVCYAKFSCSRPTVG